jgi:hypothetical protein
LKKKNQGRRLSGKSKPHAAVAIKKADWKQVAQMLMQEADYAQNEREVNREFALIWNSCPREERNRIDAFAEDFDDVPDFLNREVLAPGASRALREKLSPEALYRERIDTELNALFAELQMQSDRSLRRQLIREFLESEKNLLYAAFDVGAEAHRPVDFETERRHRHWSQLRYQGRSFSQIADEVSAQSPIAVDVALVKKSVTRYRKRRELVQWRLRQLIFDNLGQK